MSEYQNRKELQEMIVRYLDGIATPQEKRFVEEYYEYITANPRQSAAKGRIIDVRRKSYKILLRYAAALIAVACVALLGLQLIKSPSNPIASVGHSNPPSTDIAPGGDKAILTLSDGRRIVLDNSDNGTLAQDGKSSIIKKDGQIIYNFSGDFAANEQDAVDQLTYNTMTTPRGGQYKLILPDGSMVWLNAESSITFPTSFPGNERSVSVTGETYFEVSKNEKKPFRVSMIDNIQLTVLGTKFNINAYPDELHTAATLVEGSVQVRKRTAVETLEKGQQARIPANGNITLYNNVDVDKVIAWKNGSFSFNRTPLREVLRQIARWYDVDIIYDGQVPDLNFGGELKRNLALKDMLDILQKTGVQFRVEGKKLIVTS